jgi:hypothetical protein
VTAVGCSDCLSKASSLQDRLYKEDDFIFAQGERKRQPDLIPLSEVACHTRLGGLLKHYHRKAA